jgi:hypothetical protein
MKKETVLAFTAFLLLSFTAMTGVDAVEENTKTITISKEEADITGDGQNEIIYLKGVPYQEETSYLKNIYLDIKESNGKNVRLPLQSGSKAALQLVDLNDDGMKDLFVCVLTGGSGGITINYLYSFKDGLKTNLTVPEPLELSSKFINDYKAEIKISETGKSYLFDLIDREKYYKKMGLYHNGKLNEPTELTVNPFSSLQPIPLEGGKLGLKGVQRVTGIANADTIAYVQSIWLLTDGHWKLIHAEVLTDGKPFSN